MTEKQILKKRIALCQQLSQIAADNNITHEQIAERSGLIRPNVSRVLSGKYSPTLDVLLKIADAIGVKIILK